MRSWHQLSEYGHILYYRVSWWAEASGQGMGSVQEKGGYAAKNSRNNFVRVLYYREGSWGMMRYHTHPSRVQHRTGYRINKVEGVGVAYANL